MCHIVHRLCTVQSQSLCSCFLSGVARAMGGSRNHRGHRLWHGDCDLDLNPEKHKNKRNLPKHKHTSSHQLPSQIIEVVLPNTLYIVQSLQYAALYSCTLCTTDPSKASSSPPRGRAVHSCTQFTKWLKIVFGTFSNLKWPLKWLSTCRMIFKRWFQHFSAILPNLKYGILTIKEDCHS